MGDLAPGFKAQALVPRRRRGPHSPRGVQANAVRQAPFRELSEYAALRE